MSRRLIALAASAGFVSFAAYAADFDALDGDGSGGLSYAEIQAAAASVTAEEFAAADVDGSGELSRAEFEAWRSASAEPRE